MGQQSTDMDWVLIEELEAKRRQIDKEIEAVHIVIRLKQERASKVDAGGRRTGTYAQELTNAIHDTLWSERPLHRNVILERVIERGIHVGGAKPMNSVGSYLSTDKRFKNCGRGLWTLKEEPVTGIPPSDKEAGDTTGILPHKASLGNGGSFTSMEEEFVIHDSKQEGEYFPR